MNLLNIPVLALLFSINNQVFVTAKDYFRMPSLYWDYRNPFVTQNKTLCIKQNSHMYVICPNTVMHTVSSKDSPPGLSMLNENLWNVDEQGYETCKVGKTNTTENEYINTSVCKCNYNKEKYDYQKIAFSDSQANPDLIKFFSEKTYYFISTSTGNIKSLNNREGGHCKTHNMRIKFFVYDEEKCEDCTRNELGKPLDFFTCNPQCIRNTTDNSVIKCKMNWEVEQKKKDCACSSTPQITTPTHVNSLGSTVKPMTLQLTTSKHVNNLGTTVKPMTLQVTISEHVNDSENTVKSMTVQTTISTPTSLGDIATQLSSFYLLFVISLLTNYVSQ